MKVWVLFAALVAPLGAQSPGVELFEKEIRPLLVNKCYGCHSSKLKTPMGGLALDTKSGTQRVTGKLLGAVRYNDPQLRMPPTGRLPDTQIAAFEKWIALGAPDPRQDTAAAAPVTKAMDVETGRKWWAFQPLRGAPKGSIDSFILAKLKENKLKPSPVVDRRTLVQRAYLDLTGLRPSYEETEAFVADRAPGAYAHLIERLLASPHYGERWGRYWLDVARYGEDNPTSEATNPPYPFAWRYRDWVIEAVNQDVPYDRFVKLQLAADMMPDAKHLDLRALGYLGAAPIYHKDARLSKEVIETLYTDDWDERVDTVSRGLLGLTVACARCHDHKFDPILTKDYYSLAGVFASTVAAPRPLNEVDPETETRFAWAAQRLFFLSYVANLMRNEPGSKPEEAAAKSERYAEEVDKVKEGMAFLKADHPEMYAYLDQIGKRPRAPGAAPVAAAAGGQQRRRAGPSDAPFINAVFDAGLWVDGSDADLTTIEVKPGVARDLHILPHANVSAPGALAPRQFLTVLSKADTTFHQGSGRLELANRIFSDAGPLTARVIVNRVWAWHFGKPLVATASDFGTQGEKPTHPELLDDLSARFVANGWSLKWLHREIMLSAAYRQASHPREDGTRIDPTNRLLWRMNPRRLDIEAYRDSLLAASGDLDQTVYGLSVDLDAAENNRRTVYGRVSRGRLNTVLALYDFPDATMTSPARDLTTTPLQQLFVMNSQFIQDRAVALVKIVENEPDKIRAMYHRVLLRDPTPKEIDLGASYVNGSALAEYAQAILSTNEVIFWP
ncbi:MAG: hypothetical protein JWO80_5239 [Bryobacterales bacterium]|nr:hypothetical protein [Bryobacterales bacterium]